MIERPIPKEEVEDLVGEEPKGGALRRDWKLLPRILPYLRPYKKMASFSIVLTVLLAVLALAEPWPLAFVIDSIIGDETAPAWVTGIFGDSIGGLIAVAVVGTLAITALSGVMTILNEYLTTTVDQRMVLDFRSQMFKHAHKLSLNFHDNERTGVLMYRINNQASAMGEIVVGLPTLAQSALTIVGMAYIAFEINHLLALLALGVTPFIFYSTTFYADRIEPRIYKVRGMEAINLTLVHEAMAMMRVVLAFGHEKREHTRFWDQGVETVDARIDLTIRQTAFKLAIQVITAAGTAAVIGVGAYQAVQGEITAGQLLVILSYIAQVYTPLEELTSTLAAFQQWFIGLRLAFELVDTEPEIVDKPNAIDIGRARGEIELQNVGFSYKTRPHVLKDVSFKVPAGRAVAVVGSTGAGKSTLASLLPRFYDPQEGRVLIDGIDSREIAVGNLRSQFSIVLQEPLLFSASIVDNIRYGKPEATVEEVEQAARAANAHDFISGLPEGYETMLGERGTKISGGERQRISVARAFLRDAPILILDEPTSSIDSRTEAVILEALERLMQGRTTIMIAHRLSTLRSVDEILVMRDGEVVEKGTHDDLVKVAGVYRELWEAQTSFADGRRTAEALGAGPELESAERAAEELSSEQIGGAGGPGPAAVPAAGPPAEVSGPTTSSNIAATATATATPGGIKGKIVLLGMLSKIPVGGVAWLVGQYVVGFQRLGYEVYYVEAHARTPSMFMSTPEDDGAASAAAYIADVAKRFGLEDRWSFQALHDDGRCFGMSPERLDRLFRDAALIVNMHGGTLPLDEHVATDRLVYLGTDPVELELEIHHGDRVAIEFLERHSAFFTWGLNVGNPDSLLPWARSFPFVPSPPPVILDFWDNDIVPAGAPYTTIGNWRQDYRELEFEGRTYRWSKHQQFLKILDLPLRAGVPIELALSSYTDEDHLLLAEHGWRVRPGYELSRDIASYHDYIIGSAGEVSAAKEQNVHFRSGWFSERSATYLAAGRPVIVQDTGFGNLLPTGPGLRAFSDLDEAIDALNEVEADPVAERRAAREIAREYLSHEVVLGDILDHVGLDSSRGPRGVPMGTPAPAGLPRDLDLEPVSRRPLELAEETREHVLGRPLPIIARMGDAERPDGEPPRASIVMPVLDELEVTRMAIESLLANTTGMSYELLVVDNGSEQPTRDYLEAMAARCGVIELLRNEHNEGFAAACNRGLKAARGEILVLLNNDTIVPPGLLEGMAATLEDPGVGVAGPATNRCGGAAEIPTSYSTLGGMLDFVAERSGAPRGEPRDIDVVEMFCAAMRREVLVRVGDLDERFEIGMFEDDDFAHRVRGAGLRVVCDDAVFVHHFGEGSLGALAADGRYGPLFHANLRRFQDKWGREWHGHTRRFDPEYDALSRRVEAAIRETAPEGATVLVVSNGDEALLGLPKREGRHFPQDPDGGYAGHHPADDEAAIEELERERERGADFLVVPASSSWWLDHYKGFRRHLGRYERAGVDPDVALIYELRARVASEAERDPA